MASHAMRTMPGRTRRRHGRTVAMAALALAGTTPAGAVAIDHLVDLPFGTIGNLVSDAMQSESVCVDTGLLGGHYSVTAIGSGSGGAFTMAAAGQAIAYQVQWASTTAQTSGTQLTAGSALTGQPAALLDCSLGAQNNASLIVILRAAALQGAVAGTYVGTLQILLSPN